MGEEAPCLVDEEFEREMRAMGFEPGPADQAHEPSSWPFLLLPENVQALDFFIGMTTQWRRLMSPSGRTVFTGLDYAGVEAAMRLHGLDADAQVALFADLRRMEVAALPVLNADR